MKIFKHAKHVSVKVKTQRDLKVLFSDDTVSDK